jgi:hypothetical protein
MRLLSAAGLTERHVLVSLTGPLCACSCCCCLLQVRKVKAAATAAAAAAAEERAALAAQVGRVQAQGFARGGGGKA